MTDVTLEASFGGKSLDDVTRNLEHFRHLGFWSDGRKVTPPIVGNDLSTIPRVIPVNGLRIFPGVSVPRRNWRSTRHPPRRSDRVDGSSLTPGLVGSANWNERADAGFRGRCPVYEQRDRGLCPGAADPEPLMWQGSRRTSGQVHSGVENWSIPSSECGGTKKSHAQEVC